jgi:hypothetical protein
MTSTPLDRSVSPTRATLLGLALALPLAALLVWLHARRLGGYAVWQGLDAWLARPLVSVPVILAGTVVHELIHAAAWSLAPGGAWAHVRFGWQWKSLVPYAHYGAALPARAYRASAAAPLVLMGIVPALAGTWTGRGGLAAFGWLFVIGAAGDLAVLWLLRGVPRDALVEDHPTRAGCLVHR